MTTVVDRVRAVLPTVTLTRGLFHRASVERLASFDPEQTETQIEIAWMFGESKVEVPYKFRLHASRLDFDAVIEFEVAYMAEDLSLWDDTEFRAYFGQQVAMFTAYPYLRMKLHDLATTIEVPAPILDILVASPDPTPEIGHVGEDDD